MFEKLRQIIYKRRGAYKALFKIGTPAADIVLADLAQFCRARSTPAVFSQQSGTIDPIATGIAIGRLETWHRIASNLHISDADLYRLVEISQQQDQT